MAEENHSEVIMSIMTDLDNNTTMLKDVLERCEILHKMDDDPMVHSRHCRAWDIEAACVGNSWLADSCLSEFAGLIQEATPWVCTMGAMLSHEGGDLENTRIFLSIIVSLMMTGAEHAKQTLDRFGGAIEEDIIGEVTEALRMFVEDVPRKTVLQSIKEDAYSDPTVAALAELTKGGLKTRNRFYKRD